MSFRSPTLLSAFLVVVLLCHRAAAAPQELGLDLRAQTYVNELVLLQQLLVEGDRKAITQYRETIRSVDRRLMALPDTAFERPMTINAVVKFLLMGGHPRVGRRVLKILKKTDRPMGLLFAATAFATGRPSLAKKWLLKENALDAPATIAGNIALAKGLLVAAKKPKDAIQFFEQALVLAPGTLVAESALRQLIAIPAIVQSSARLRYIGSRYLMRYQNSVFSVAFRHAYAQAFVRLGHTADTEKKWLFELLKSQPAMVRADYAIEIARAAFVSGKVDLVEFAAKIISPDKVESAADRERFSFYTKATAMISGGNGVPTAAINEIDAASLSGRDARLLQASQHLVKAIRERPSLDTPKEGDGTGKNAPPTRPKVVERGVLDQGRQVIASIDKLLEQ